MTIQSWSYSRLTVFEQCKHRAWLQFSERIPDPRPSVAAGRGTEIHSLAEDYVRGLTDAFPPQLAKFEIEIKRLRALFTQGRVELEEDWGYDKEWKPTEWKAAWLRMKCDAVVWLNDKSLVIIDYKTGKRFNNEIKHGEQTMLYAAAAYARYPEITKVYTELWYLDIDELAYTEYTRTRALHALSRFNDRGLKLTDCTQFPPNPTQYTCKWCPYKPSGTGHCQRGIG